MKVPVINGYQYNNSIKLGNNIAGNGADKASYIVDIPADATNFNLTYAYALILQNPGHPPDAQPKFRASIIDLSNDSKINCASREYFTGDGQNYRPVSNPYYGDEEFINWQEVSFDLTQYAGKKIELRFEMFDCAFGGHFGYGYIALRNDGCGKGVITGNAIVCASNSNQITYSTPNISGANYTWTLPNGWTSTGSSTSNSISVNPNGNPGGYITVTPSQSCGNITTNSLAVKTTNSIPVKPGAIQGDATVCANSNNLVYTVPALENASSYTWDKPSDWTIVSGTNSNTITLNAGTSTGTINVTATNSCGTSLPSSFPITVSNNSPSLAGSITGVPTIDCSDNFQSNPPSLTLGTSTGTIQYWLSSTDGGISWSNISNTNSTLTITPTTSTLYKAVVQNVGCSNDESDPVLVEVYSSIGFINQPASVNTCENLNKTFSISALGDGTLSYNWQVSDDGITWSDISNTTSATTNYSGYDSKTLTVNSGLVTIANSGKQYRCIVSTSVNCSPVTSSIAVLNVGSSSTPVITSEPADKTLCTGSTANISVLATGPTLTYQWLSSNTLNGNYTNAGNLSTLSISTSNAGTNYYKCIVTESCGNLTTTTGIAKIDILNTLVTSATITSTTNQVLCQNLKTFTAIPTNAGATPVYAWYKNGNLVLGQSTSIYSSNDFLDGDLVFAVITTNEACAIGIPASTNALSTSIAALPTLSVSSISLCKESTYLLTNTTAMPVNNGWSITGSNNVNNGYVTAGANPGSYYVSYTDGCAHTVTATVVITESSNLAAITDGVASYKISTTNPQPQGPSGLGAGNVYYVGYNGYNYYSTSKPTNTGFYKVNNFDTSTASSGCPYPFYIFRCSTCPD